MSLYTNPGDAVALQPSADLAAMLHDGSMMNGLDIDMSLPMDLDLDLSSAAAEQVFPSAASHNNAHNLANLPPSSALERSLAAPNSDNNGLGFGSQLQQAQDNDLSGVGAGPLPTGFGMPAQGSSSTLTEFTKRRNWSQRIIEEIKDFLHILTADGRILYVSPSCRSLTGYEPHTLIGKFIGEFVHPDDSGIFMREFNESIASGNALRFFYRFKKEDGTYMIFECDGHPHISPEPDMSPAYQSNESGQNLPIAGLCRGFFMMARPYPTRNAALLDSFLEHKIENERLRKRIEELKREEVEENAEQDRLYREGPQSQSGETPSENAMAASRPQGDSTSPKASSPSFQGMPPPAKPSISNTALTRQNLDSALSAQKPDSILDKMSRYENNNAHLESIEMLTGLRYRDGERSHGISTGDQSPALIRGDAGIAILLDRDRDSKKPLKKPKVADEYVCADCGTLDSPEWRKGPKGPKTLCNACGLRWAKKEKKRSGDDVKTNSPASGMHMGQPGQISLTASGQPPGLPNNNSTGDSGGSM